MKFLQEQKPCIDGVVLCHCNKPARMLTELGKNQIRWRCDETYLIAGDIKINKGAPAWPVWDETKHGSPCDFVKTIPITKRPTHEKWEKLSRLLLKCLDPVNIPKYGTQYNYVPRTSEKDEHKLFVSTLKLLCQRARKRSSWSPMSWEFISKMNYYATQHLLIPPFKISGRDKETWDQFIDRFESAEWVSKKWKLRLELFQKLEQAPQKRLDNIDKQVEIFEGLPRLKKKIRKSLKKEWKKKEKEIVKNDKNVEHQAFRKFFKQNSLIKPSPEETEIPQGDDEDLEVYSIDDDAHSLDGNQPESKGDSDDETSQNLSSQSDQEEEEGEEDDYGLDGDGPDYGDLAGDGFGGEAW